MVSRRSWRPEALKIRARFDAAKDVRDVKLASALLERGEAELEALKHPDPYISEWWDGSIRGNSSGVVDSFILIRAHQRFGCWCALFRN